MSELLAGHQGQNFGGPPGSFQLLVNGSDWPALADGFTGAAPRTFEFWTKIAAPTQSANFFAGGVYGYSEGSFMLDYLGGSPGNCYYKFTTYGGDFICFLPMPATRQVHHAVSYDGDVVRLYVDFVLVGSRQIGAIDTRTAPTLWGRGEATGTPTKLAGMRIWSTVRTQAELEANASVYVAANAPGLWADWPLSEGGGSVAGDRSVAGRDLSVPASTAWLTA